MGSKSKPSANLPPAPSFQANPNVEPNIDFLSSVGRGLSSGDFLDPGDAQLGFLNQLVTLNPEATQQAVGLASRDVIRVRDQAQQSVLNQLEANNQLTSSTTANALTDLNEQFSSDISDIATNFYLADVERALGNIGSLFELGLNTTSNATSLGLNDQNQRNTFALQNYNNQVAASLASQPQSRGGGGLGGLIGTGVGAVAGSFIPGVGTLAGAGLGGALGGVAGDTFFPGSFNTGSGFVQGGLGLAGAGLGAGSGSYNTNIFSGRSSNQTSDYGLRLRDDLYAQRRFGLVA